MLIISIKNDIKVDGGPLGLIRCSVVTLKDVIRWPYCDQSRAPCRTSLGVNLRGCIDIGVLDAFCISLTTTMLGLFKANHEIGTKTEW